MVIPKTAVGNKLPLLSTTVEGAMAAALCGLLSSMCVDYAVRQSSNSMNFFIVQQAPILSPDQIRGQVPCLCEPTYLWISRRVVELSYTTHSVSAFARECGDHGAPFRWSNDRRALIQAELDAAVFHLYGLNRSQVYWVLDSFRVLEKNESKDYGEYRTKRLILEVFDTMEHAIDAAEPYETSLNPAPGFGPRHAAHPSPQETSS